MEMIDSLIPEHQQSGMPVQQQPEQQTDFAFKRDGTSNKPTESNEFRVSQGLSDKQVQPSQIQVTELSERPSQIPVIELSDDDVEETEKASTTKQVLDEQLKSMMWHYRDPQGNVQGPFNLTLLKRWSDARYFAPDFKVWKSGQSQDEGVLLVDILPQIQVIELSKRPSQIPVIELSDDDDEETEKVSTTKQVPAEQLGSMIWHYRDPKGNIQGPFNLTLLKRWSDARYFAPDFKVWKSGQSQDEGVLLVDILPQFFPHGSNFI